MYYARLFNTQSDATLNGARVAAHSWELDQIELEPIEGSQWTSPGGKIFYLQYHIHLRSSDWPGELTVTALRQNQTVTLAEGEEYQGLALVEGTLKGQAVHGQCWIEIQPVQPAAQ
jgi:hypothetical protein